MRPQPCATNVGANRLGHHERPVEVDVDGVTPGVGADLVEFFPRPDEHVADVLHAHAGVVDEAVHGAEALDRRRDGGAARLPTRDVAIDGMDALLQLLRAGEVDELAHGRLARRQIGDRHAHARLGETERHGAPEAARAAGHDHGQIGWRNPHNG
jgi:hypothetical protein